MSQVPIAPGPDSHAGGEEELVILTAEHPGFLDVEYRQRRNRIARTALDNVAGSAVPDDEYTESEHGVWREVW